MQLMPYIGSIENCEPH